MDDLVRDIVELAEGRQRLARKAVRQYSDEVEVILKARHINLEISIHLLITKGL